MKKTGQIIIIDDDEDDRLIFEEILKSLNLPNEIILLSDSTEVIPFLQQEHIKPFMVISDINMPKMNGFELRDEILKDEMLTEKTLPFIFFTTVGSGYTVEEAFKRSIHGYFHKTSDMQRLTETLKEIVDYWCDAVVPEIE
ncbi:response regulator [Flavobacterium sp. NRK1]|uniref:response regulator n=1 Tax=Flavobacterium sp. NRK1 TaxID=2954929 RepID=UPI002093A2CD|nr:response regulator [Flavobacterium sp. NRK1]MCO6147408.1 response regulator [Flavobacterium sp. NRK1]